MEILTDQRDTTGAQIQLPVTAAWVNDGISWRQGTVAAIWDSAYPGGARWRYDVDSIANVTCTLLAVDHSTLRISWSLPLADSVRLFVNGTEKFLIGVPENPTPALPKTGSYHDVVRSGAISSAYMIATYGKTAIKQAVPTSIQMPAIPAPATVTVGASTVSSQTIAWSAITGLSIKYRVYNAATNAQLYETYNRNWVRTGLTSNTAYSYYVRAVSIYGDLSVPSKTVVASTAKTYKTGTATFRARSNNTFQATARTWRGTATNEVFHGDARKWEGTTRGIQSAWFTDYRYAGTGSQTIMDFYSGWLTKVSKIEVLIYRRNSANGLATPDQTCRFYRHQYAVLPTTNASPAFYGASHNNGTLGRGESAWITLPVSWGASLISGAAKGIIWGGTAYYSDGSRYMVGPSLLEQPRMAELRITTTT